MSNSLRFHDLAWRHIGLAAVGGALVGLLLGPGLDLSGTWKTLDAWLQRGLIVLAGAAVATLVYVAVRLLLAGGTRLSVDSAKVRLPEQSWPLAARCREDLEATRLAVLGYSRGLGEALRVPQLDSLLAPPDTLAPGATVSGAPPAPLLGAIHRKTGWRIYVQLQTRVATQSLAADEGLLSEALASLYTLFDTIRTELSILPGPAPSTDPDRSVEAISLRILNVHLRPLLAYWHPRLEARKASNGNEADWSEAEPLRVVLERTRQAVVDETSLLGELIEAPTIEPS